MDKIKVNIGLDVGIASLGWAILDAKNFKIIKHGARLFETVDDPKDHNLQNQIRRQKRSMRRVKNRRKNLKLDFVKLLKEYQMIDLNLDPLCRKRQYHFDFIENYIDDNLNLNDPFLKEFTQEQIDLLKTSKTLFLRLKGLKHPLKGQDLIQALYWYLSHRGLKYEVIEDDGKKKDKESDKKQLEAYDSEKLPIENQWDYYQKNHLFRSWFNRSIWNKDYNKELEIILKNANLNQGFVNEYLELFNRQRSYEKGPGPKNEYKNLKKSNYHLISPHSRFYVDQETNGIKSHDNMWATTVGKCTYFSEQNRAPRNSVSAEFFNLLNDLNNLWIGLENNKTHLNYQTKIECLQIALTTKDNTNKITNKIMANLNVEKDDIRGFRVTGKSGDWKSLATPLTSLIFINKILKEENQELTWDHFYDGEQLKLEKLKEVDQIIDVLSRFKTIQERQEKLSEIKLPFLNQNVIKKISEKAKGFSENHSLSYEAMHKMIPILLKTNQNQMEIAKEHGWLTKSRLGNSSKYLPTKWIDEVVITPTVKRSLRQTINFLNCLIKQHREYQIENIVLEMPREHNNKHAKEAIQKLQKYLESRNSKIKNRIEEIEDRLKIKVMGQAVLKVQLWEQQDGRDAYTGELLDLDKVVSDWSYTDIDHIVPYSQCFDDSRHNKVLVLRDTNSQKREQPPYKFLSHENFSYMDRTYWKKWYFGENREKRPGPGQMSKYELITSTIDFSKPENAYGFIGRNLVDTRYIAKEMFGLLKEFANNANSDHPMHKTKIKTVNGKATSYLRKRVDTKKHPLTRPPEIINMQDNSSSEAKKMKSRIWKGHHAQDAVMIVHLALKNPHLGKLIEKIGSDSKRDLEKFEEKSESYKRWTEKISPDDICQDLNDNFENVKFSYMLNKKINTQLFNESLYGFKKEDGKIKKVSRVKIADSLTDPKDLEKIFTKEDKNRKIALDQKTFNALKEIWLNKGEHKNPFLDNADPKGNVTIFVKNKKGEMIKRKVKNITLIYEGAKDPEEIIWRKDHKGNERGFHDTLDWTAVHIFKDRKGKYKIIPLNALTVRYRKSDPRNPEYKDLYYKKIEDNDIDKNSKPIVIYKGAIIQDKEGILYRVCGQQKKGLMLEVKRLDGIPKFNQKNQETRERPTLNKALLGWKIVELDYLGNVYPKQIF